MLRTIDQLELSGKRVFIRADLDVPVDGKTGAVLDDARIHAALPTLRHALARKAKVMVGAHLGRPEGAVVPRLSLEAVGARLSELLAQDVWFADDCVGDGVKKLAGDLREGQVLLLENLRFHPEEEKNDEAFARELAALCEVYVGDAFAAAHRAHASTAGMLRALADRTQKAAGLALARELAQLQPLLKAPARPFVAVVGGPRLGDKLKLLEQLIGRADALLVGGGAAVTLLAARGVKTGASRVEKDRLEAGVRLLDAAGRKGVEVLLPKDHLVAAEATAAAATRTEQGPIPDGLQALDLGPRAIADFSRRILGAKTVLWVGAPGRFELAPFSTGTRAVAQALADAARAGATVVVAGADAAAAMAECGLAGQVTHVSTGGAAALELLEGRELPGVAALEQ